MPIRPALTHRTEDGLKLPVLVWRLPRPLRAIASTALGGGLGTRHWLINATVPMSYRRDDPEVHLADLAHGLKLSGPGIGLLTGVDVAELVTRDDGGVRVWATVGLGAPIWAAAPDPPPAIAPPQTSARAPADQGRVGTINVVVLLPVRMSDAALVNAVATVTEAKAQALSEMGLAATGTATDAVVVLCPPDGPPQSYGGPRSRWGAPLARATRAAVLARGPDPGPAWSVRHEAAPRRSTEAINRPGRGSAARHDG
nr:adenosylcobinamide amidohydrolase [Micromonospora sp. DSM 115978]